MANSTPWSERSGAQKRRTYGGFGLLYGLIALVTLAFGWFLIGAVFGIGAIGLAVARFTTTPTEAPTKVDHPKPAWMLAMDDPDAPDLSLPEYRAQTPVSDGRTPTSGPPETADARPDEDRPTGGRVTDTRSPFDRPPTGEVTTGSSPPEAGPSAADR